MQYITYLKDYIKSKNAQTDITSIGNSMLNIMKYTCYIDDFQKVVCINK